MRQNIRIKKTGKPKPMRPRGIKLTRQRKFQPVLPTKSGVTVRSKSEIKCADFLHKHNIRFQYEPLILLDNRKFRPDFYLPDYNLFIEICGYDHMPHYRNRVDEKKRIYEKYNLNAVFIHYCGRGSLEEMLRLEFHKFGVDKL
jgi:DNA helicase-4